MLRIGVAIFTEKGFHNTPVDELVAAAGVPKGSFAYYFGSKDSYTLAVIESYAVYFNRKLDRVLQDESLTPLDRIARFAEEAALGMERFEFRRGCLVGNLGQEMGALDERYRMLLLSTLRGWQTRIQICLDEAKRCGQVKPSVDTANLAKLFWYAWEGAVLGAKLERSREPLDSFAATFLEYIRSS